jgi:phosphoribosyl 1,2-cyclic phosphodiesterase
MLRLASVGSGSKGNATLVATDETTILIDCGFPVREMLARLPKLGVDISDIDAILVTHEHSDHIGGVAAVAKAAGAQVFATHGTVASGKLDAVRSLVRIDSDSSFAIGDIEVNAVTVPHDAREPVQYRFHSGLSCVGVLTDLGWVSPHVLSAYKGCDLLLLEFNHDLEMLRRGPYPAVLKRRVSGDFGHLNNEQATTMLTALGDLAPRVVIAGHISEQNNSVDRVAELLTPLAERQNVKIIYATQTQGFGWTTSESSGDVSRVA